MRQKSQKLISVPVYVVWIAIVFVVNTVILDVLFIRSLYPSSAVLGETTGDTCPQACITRMNQLTTRSTASKEYYVPLGSGSGSSSEWADVPGAAAYINTASYGKIKQAVFEVTTAIPAGGQRIWVRLYNATDKHPVWFSDLTTDTSSAILLTSAPITLDSGSKLYQVQLKTQLKVLTNVIQARIKITAN